MTLAPPEDLPKSETHVPDAIENAPFSASEKAVPAGDGTGTDEESGPSQRASPTKELQRWNQSPTNIFRFLASTYAFALMGMTDAAVGVRPSPFSKTKINTPLLTPPRLSSHTYAPL